MSFEDVRIGDKLWSIQLGDCEVIQISHSFTYPIMVKSVYTEAIQEYTFDGCKTQTDIHQSLFWSNPNFLLSQNVR